MINAVDGLLAKTLKAELGRVFSPEEMPDVTFAHPSALAGGDRPVIAIYLYELKENTALRQDPFVFARRPDGKAATKQRSTLRFDLTYAVSIHAADPSAEHGLLTYVLGVFLRNPVLPLPKTGDEDEETITITIAQPEHDASLGLRDLWRALGRPPGPALTLRVSAPFNPFDPEVVPLVRQAVFGWGQGTEPGFLPHPVDVRAISLSAAGIVTDDQGEPLPHVLVSVVDRLERTVTGEDGRYLLLDLPPGPCVLVFERRGYRPVRRDYTVPPPGRVHEITETDVTLAAEDGDEAVAARRGGPPEGVERYLNTELRQRRQVVGRLSYPDQRPASYVRVSLGNQATVTDSQGVYAFSQAPWGTPLLAEIPGRGLVPVEEGKVVSVPQEDEASPVGKEPAREKKSKR